MQYIHFKHLEQKKIYFVENSNVPYILSFMNPCVSLFVEKLCDNYEKNVLNIEI